MASTGDHTTAVVVTATSENHDGHGDERTITMMMFGDDISL